jgi:hypothetical protein
VPERRNKEMRNQTAAPAMAKIPGMMWHRMVRANSTAARARCRPFSMPRPTTPRNSKAKLSEMEKANSPAMVEAMLPP